jgi:hypothetical protein
LELIAAKKAETARLEADERKARELERMEKDAEKKKLASLAPQAGSLVIKNPRSITSLSSSLVEAPSVYQSSLLHRVIPPLHFFTTERLKEVVDFPQKLIKETLTLEALPGKKAATVQVIDLAKMTKTWGVEDSSMSALSWYEASKNCLDVWAQISAKNVPGEPYQHTYAEEYEQHIYFFRHIEGFEILYPVWRSEEIELRRRIFAGTLFSVDEWSSRVRGVLIIHKKMVERFGEDGALAMLSYPSSSSSSSSSSASSSKRSASVDNNPGPSKSARSSGGSQARDGGAAPRADAAPLVCLTCAEPHRVNDHPHGNHSFRDGSAHKSRFDGKLRSAQASANGEYPLVCVTYNLNSCTCDRKHNPPQLHQCSLCGGAHPALSRSADCARFTNGVARP